MPQGLFSRHEHKGLRDFSLHLFVLNGFLPVLGSLSAHRALLHRPQTGTCLQPVPNTGLWDNAFIVFQVEQHSAFVLFWCLVWLFTNLYSTRWAFRVVCFRRLCRHISMSRVPVPQHTLFFFFGAILLKNRSNPRSVPYIYRNQGMVLTLDVRFWKYF